MGEQNMIQALVSPIEKLISAVSGAIGKAYEPRHQRKMTDAKAYELYKIADAVRNNSDVPIVYDSTGVTIDTSNYEEIAKRASNRLAFQEIYKQQNIEAVTDKAYEELEGVEFVSNEPVSQDWMFRFFNSVEDISNEEMQRVWGQILAGEIKTPNTYSYRTLEKLRNMTLQEVEVFQLVSAFSIQSSNKYFLLSNKDILDNYNIDFENIMALEECGLMTSRELSFNFEATEKTPGIIYNSRVVGLIRGTKKDNIQKVSFNIYPFTESGKQLIKSIKPQENEQYIIDCLQRIREKNKDLSVLAHRINQFVGESEMDYDPTDILPIV